MSRAGDCVGGTSDAGDYVGGASDAGDCVGGASGVYDYVTIGHVTVDVIEDAPGGARRQPGGGAFYSALQAARLGLRTLVMTQGVQAEIERMLLPFADELDVVVLASSDTTTLATRGSGAARTQRVVRWAGAIEHAPAIETSIVHFAPVVGEVTARTTAAWAGVTGSAEFVALTPQGLVRAWSESGQLTSKPLDVATLPERVDAAVFNEGERASCDVLLRSSARAMRGIVAVTAAREPIELHCGEAAPSGHATPPGQAARADQATRGDQAAPPGQAARADQAAQTGQATRPGQAARAGQVAPPGDTARPAEAAPFYVTPVRLDRVCDDLGAGDVFAAAFFIALARGDSPVRATRLGSAAAAVRMSGEGPAAVGDMAAIESLL